MKLAGATLAVVAQCISLALMACPRGGAETGRATGSESGASDSGEPQVDLPADEAVPYGPCNPACEEPEFACTSCGMGCAGPTHEGDFKLCCALCETAADCPPPPIPGNVVCLYGGCYQECEAAPCPEGQTCVFFATVDDPPVCMYFSDPV